MIINLLSDLSTDHDIILEAYVDKGNTNILDIDRYFFKYDVRINEMDENYAGEGDVTLFYDKQHSLAFALAQSASVYEKIAEYAVYAKDSDGNIVSKANLSKTYDSSIQYDSTPKFDAIDSEKKGNLLLDDWMALKGKLGIPGDDFVWQRVFYFANFMGGRVDVDDYHINILDLPGIAIVNFYEEEFENAVNKLRPVVYASSDDECD